MCVRRSLLACFLLSLGSPGSSETLTDPVADAALDCAALTIVLGGEAEVIRRSVSRAVRAEGAATGSFSERLIPRLQAELIARAEAYATLSRSEAEARAAETCPSAL